MGEFESLKNEINHYVTDQESALIETAYQFAKKAHGSQTRYTGEPYITHPVAVAVILAEMRMDTPSIIAGLLHDVVEDTPVTHEDIQTAFGQEVSELVDGVTKLRHIQFENYAEVQAENFRKMVMAMASDIRVVLVKLADRLHNMRTLQSLPPQKRRRKSLETLEIFAPIANRLGMHNIRIELEDLGFSAYHPMRYRILKEAVSKAHGNRKEIVQVIMKEMEDKLKQAAISEARLSGRNKHLYSIYKKMHTKHLSFSEIMDVYGFRVIVDNVDTCYRVLGALHNLYKPIAQRFKDYIAIPKANGYQSLHTTLFGPYGVPIEVQIRTEEMHRMAENGIAAHWLYKSEKTLYNNAQLKAREWLNSILELDKSARNSIEFVEDVKIELFPDECYVFTPKGHIIELPAGATPVDFAYAIHTDIGNTCVAARIDKRLSPLSTPLASGQQVEIIAAPGARPNAAWLHYVVTGKARNKIKDFLKKQQRDESITLGKHLIDKALHSYQINLSTVSKSILKAVAASSKLDNFKHLFEEVGMGNRPALLVARQIALQAGEIALKENEEHHTTKPLIIKGSEGLVLRLAICCRPIPGDHIAGIVIAGSGVEVHVVHCAKLAKYHHQFDKHVNLQWQENIAGDFSVDLCVDLFNKRGSLAAFTLAISEAESNISDIKAQESDAHHFHVDVTVSVKDRHHLAKIIRKVRNRKEVIRVARKK